MQKANKMETKQSTRIINKRVFPTRNNIGFAHQPADSIKGYLLSKIISKRVMMQMILKRNLPRIFL
jgi:hypothetical protein